MSVPTMNSPSQYSVRGGNYDENLIYVNDYEIFRPYLVSNAQQEGLSFINPEMTHNVNFYNGGFQAKYGDKISSVLDIQYKKPAEFGGSAYISLLEQGLELEGVSNNKKFSYIVGARNRSFTTLLSSQEVKGNYIPSSSDIQGLFSYQLNQKNSLELFTVYSQTSFNLIPSRPSSVPQSFLLILLQTWGSIFFSADRKKINIKPALSGSPGINRLIKT